MLNLYIFLYILREAPCYDASMAKPKSKRDRYTWKRPESRYIWFRLAVPKPYRSIAGKKLILESLETTDERKASMLAAARRAQLYAEWEAAAQRAEPPVLHIPTDEELEEAAVVIAHDLVLEQIDEERRSIGPHLLPYVAERVRRQLEEQTRYALTGDLSLVRAHADEAIEALAFDLPSDSNRYQKFCELLNTALHSALARADKQNQGDLEAEPQNALVRRVREREAVDSNPDEVLSALFELYAAELLAERSKRPAGVDQDRMVVDLFCEFVGRHRTASAIRFEDAKAFVDFLPRLPKNFRKRRDYRGLTVRQAVEKGERDGAEKLSVITQQRYISTLSPFFAWLKSDKGGRRISANFFESLHKDTSRLKRSNARPPFTAEQITKIIDSPLFTGFLADGREHLPGERHADDWRRWIPLICLFTGARIGEVAQLRVDDIYREHGIWCVELREDEVIGQQTKSRRPRTVPLHSTLVKIGLSGFLDRQKNRSETDSNLQLFPELQPGKRGQYGDLPSDWWRDYLTAIGIKTGSDGLGAHSFRHTMADQLRAAGYLDSMFGPLILGHGSYGTTGGYGEKRQGTIEMASKMIESVKFIPIVRGRVVEGGKPVDFAHLM